MTDTSEESSGLGELTAKQYRALIEQTSDVITVVDAEGTIRYQSPNSERVKRWPPEELIGENILDYVHPEDKSRVIEQFSALVEGSGVIKDEIEFRFRTKDRGWIWLAVTGAAPGAEVPVDGYVTTSRDISRRKAYEQRLVGQRDDLETLNGVVRHDIRNDLQLIAGAAETLEPHVDDDGQELLETIQESASDAVSLTTAARDLAEVMLRPDDTTDSIRLMGILSEQVDALKSSYPNTTVTVEEVPETTVQAGELLSSVFRNLLTNAVQHNDKDVAEITVSGERAADRVTVRIADNGPGVRESMKDDIFGKGEKGLESAGTGIGLYLVQSLVESYGGDIRVEDNDPTGAVFVVELQAAE
ncbi:ATP-binding protein [Natronoarchaeum sp. GCM10025321]|uniref:ATP-binding protein n=1 Tax=Natronoarchaeum sp. GCM10025321 TaxID=3252684 RepID=UPI0036109566